MDGVRDRGGRRLVVVTVGVGVLAAGAASAVGATRPAPHRATPAERAARQQTPEPAQPDGNQQADGPSAPTGTDQPPVTTSNGS